MLVGAIAVEIVPALPAVAPKAFASVVVVPFDAAGHVGAGRPRSTGE